VSECDREASQWKAMNGNRVEVPQGEKISILLLMSEVLTKSCNASERKIYIVGLFENGVR